MAGPAEVVRAFGAMQAQEFLQAKWGLSQRSEPSSGRVVDDAAIDAAFAEGSILRTHILRPTWHFVHRDDLRWMMRLSAPRVHQQSASYYRQFGLDDATVRSSQAILRAELTDGRQRTRKELAEALALAGCPAAGISLGYVMIRAELDAVVVSGARRGRQQTYALFDDRVPPATEFDDSSALAELTRRYFSMRGPASVKDFATWASLTTRQARDGIDALGSRIERSEFDGVPLFDLPEEAPAAVAGAGARVDLIQGYDEYVMSYRETRIAPLATREGGGQPDYLHTILADGQVAGRWKHAVRAGAVTVEAQLHRALSAAEREALDDAVSRFGIFLGLPARWVERA